MTGSPDQFSEETFLIEHCFAVLGLSGVPRSLHYAIEDCCVDALTPLLVWSGFRASLWADTLQTNRLLPAPKMSMGFLIDPLRYDGEQVRGGTKHARQYVLP